LALRRIDRWERGWTGCRSHCSPPRPDQDFPRLINRELSGVDEFSVHIFKVLVIHIEGSLQRPVCYPPMALQQGDHLLEHLIEGHHRPSTWASVASAWGRQQGLSMAWSRVMAGTTAAWAPAREHIVVYCS